MKTKSYRLAFPVLIAALLLMIGLAAACRQQGQVEGITNFDDLVVNSVTAVGQIGAADLDASDDLVVDDDATITDDLIVGGDATVTGTVSAEQLTSTDDATITDDLDVGGSLNFGADNLFPLGHGTDGEQLVTGTDDITGTLAVDHGLTTVTWAMCTLGQDPDTDAGDAAVCSVTVAADVVTVKVWQDDFAAATEVDVAVHWLVIGTP